MAEIALTHGAASVADIIAQVQMIQQLLRQVMVEGTHYDTIPGCGPKPVLLQPGAQKLCLMFRLVPTIVNENPIELPGGHREYRCKVRLEHGPTEEFVGEGIGVCSTLERRYRYRSEPVEDANGEPLGVPKEYWKSRDPDLIGGPQFKARKRDGRWVVCHEFEHDNPADNYNTCQKMAVKRAYVHAALNATAASDLFTQDLEDADEPSAREKPPPRRPRRKPVVADATSPRTGPVDSHDYNRLLEILKIYTIPHDRVMQSISQRYHVKKISELNRSQFEELIEELVDGAEEGARLEQVEETLKPYAADVANFIKDQFGATKVSDLSRAQMDEVFKWLNIPNPETSRA